MFNKEVGERLVTDLNSRFQPFVSEDKLNENDVNIKELILEIETIRQTLESVGNLKCFSLKLIPIFDQLKRLKATNDKLWPIRSLLWFDIQSYGKIMEENNYHISVKTETQKLIKELIEEVLIFFVFSKKLKCFLKIQLKNDLPKVFENRVLITVIEDLPTSETLVRKVRQSVNIF